MEKPSEETITKFKAGEHSAFIVGYTGETGRCIHILSYTYFISTQMAIYVHIAWLFNIGFKIIIIELLQTTSVHK